MDPLRNTSGRHPNNNKSPVSLQTNETRGLPWRFGIGISVGLSAIGLVILEVATLGSLHLFAKDWINHCYTWIRDRWDQVISTKVFTVVNAAEPAENVQHLTAGRVNVVSKSISTSERNHIHRSDVQERSDSSPVGYLPSQTELVETNCTSCDNEAPRTAGTGSVQKLMDAAKTCARKGDPGALEALMKARTEAEQLGPPFQDSFIEGIDRVLTIEIAMLLLKSTKQREMTATEIGDTLKAAAAAAAASTLPIRVYKLIEIATIQANVNLADAQQTLSEAVLLIDSAGEKGVYQILELWTAAEKQAEISPERGVVFSRVASIAARKFISMENDANRVTLANATLLEIAQWQVRFDPLGAEETIKAAVVAAQQEKIIAVKCVMLTKIAKAQASIDLAGAKITFAAAVAVADSAPLLRFIAQEQTTIDPEGAKATLAAASEMEKKLFERPSD